MLTFAQLYQNFRKTARVSTLKLLKTVKLKGDFRYDVLQTLHSSLNLLFHYWLDWVSSRKFKQGVHFKKKKNKCNCWENLIISLNTVSSWLSVISRILLQSLKTSSNPLFSNSANWGASRNWKLIIRVEKRLYFKDKVRYFIKYMAFFAFYKIVTSRIFKRKICLKKYG